MSNFMNGDNTGKASPQCTNQSAKARPNSVNAGKGNPQSVNGSKGNPTSSVSK